MRRWCSFVVAAALALALGPEAALAADPAPVPPPPAPATSPPAALPAPVPAPPPAPTPPIKKIVVSLGQEKLFAYENGIVVGQSIVTSGGPLTRTPRGTFAIVGKRSNFYMTSPWPEDDWRWYEAAWVNYALLFEWTGYFIHDAPWRHNFGPGSNVQYGTAGGDFTGTHGCVNVPLQFERDLFNWAQIGTHVVVQP